MTDKAILEVQDLAVNFGGVRAVDGVSFHVRPGEVFTIVGPNGAGKTTVFNLISRIYDVTAGSITFQGNDITGVAPHRVAAMGIARTFQNIELFEHATVLQNLLVGRHPHRRTNLASELLFLPHVRRAERGHREKVEEVIDLLDLQSYRNQFIANLPYGIRKVVEIGRALCTEPTLLLLDEPSSGLSVEETEDVSFWIDDIKNDLGVTIIMVEHDMSLVAEVSDRVMAMNEGKLLALGTPQKVQADAGVRRAYLGA